MSDAAPKAYPDPANSAARLPSGGDRDAYAPISGLAVAALAVALLFALLAVVGAAAAYRSKTAFEDTWLLVFPPLAVVLAFVARRRIRAAEGTVTGEKYANLAWTVAVVGGLVFVAYLAAIDYAVRSEARREFTAWAAAVEQLNPADPRDPALYRAVYEMIPTGNRQAVGNAANVSAIDSTFGPIVQSFRTCDLVRVARRNPGQVALRYDSVLKREQVQGVTSCMVAATLVTPEGEHACLVPMRADLDTEKQRRWQVIPPNPVGGGFVVGRRLKPYGWAVEALEGTSRNTAGELMSVLQRPGSFDLAYTGYIDPTSDAKQAAELFERVFRSAEGRRALLGVAGGLVAPSKPGSDARLYGTVFRKPDGAALAPYEAETFKETWRVPGRLAPAGAVLKSNPDKLPVVTVTADRIECAVPAEIVLTQEGPAQRVALAHIILRMPPADEKIALAELASLKAAGGALTDRPQGVPPSLTGARWRVTGIVSDLKPIAVQQERPPQGGPGM